MVVTIAALPCWFPAFTEAPAEDSMDFLEEVLEGRLDLEIGFSAGVLIAISAQQTMLRQSLGQPQLVV